MALISFKDVWKWNDGCEVITRFPWHIGFVLFARLILPSSAACGHVGTGGCTKLGELKREPVACAVLNLRGGGRHHKAKEKAVYQDKVSVFRFPCPGLPFVLVGRSPVMRAVS